MAKEILDNSAIFCCQNGIGVFFSVSTGQVIAKGNGKFFLNTKTKCSLNSPGQCKSQPNPSGVGFLPCNQITIPSAGAGWQGADQVIRIDGSKALTEDASTTCPLGGKICLMGRLGSIFHAGCSLAIKEIAVKKAAKKIENKQNPQGVSMPSRENGGAHLGEIGRGREGEKKVTENTAKGVEEPGKYAKCPYEKCEERDSCAYYNAETGIGNNSAKLKQYFERDRANEDNAYKEQHRKARADYPEYGWGYEGHHIISGNQVFMAVDKGTKDLKYGHLLRLANMCGYNINNANNCILLPSIARKEGPWGALELFVKEARSFDVMDIMKRQWHLGTHAYTIPKGSLKYYKPSGTQALSSGSGEYFPNYATSVQARLDGINARYSRKRCWKKIDSQEFRDKFKGAMDGVSREIEEMLMKFSDRPKDSYPFFVSKMSVDYAYDAPKTGKIILIYKKDGSMYASKFRVSRKQKDHYQVTVTQNKEDFKMGQHNLREFVSYCENIMHFWIDSGVGYRLPWNEKDESICNDKKINGDDIYSFACANATELFTFLDKNEVKNHGQIARIRKRWGEVKENAAICN